MQSSFFLLKRRSHFPFGFLPGLVELRHFPAHAFHLAAERIFLTAHPGQLAFKLIAHGIRTAFLFTALTFQRADLGFQLFYGRITGFAVRLKLLMLPFKQSLGFGFGRFQFAYARFEFLNFFFPLLRLAYGPLHALRRLFDLAFELPQNHPGLFFLLHPFFKFLARFAQKPLCFNMPLFFLLQRLLA